MKSFVTIKHGSHLYGTDTPSSDTDFKGIYMPTMKELVLNQYESSIDLNTSGPEIKNSSKDIDHTIYAFPKFVQMLKNGDMVALDMLFCRKPSLSRTKGINPFTQLQNNKDMFLSKNVAGYLSYVRKYGAKYGLKGTRMNSLKVLMDTLEEIGGDPSTKLGEFATLLPVDEYCFMDGAFYNVMGSKYQMSVPYREFFRIIQKKYSEYGHRSKKSMDNDGVDWKSLHHAVRVSYQLTDILHHHNVTFPFSGERLDRLMKIKKGEENFNSVKSHLEELSSMVIQLQDASSLPDEIDGDAIDDLTYHIINDYWMKN